MAAMNEWTANTAQDRSGDGNDPELEVALRAGLRRVEAPESLATFLAAAAAAEAEAEAAAHRQRGGKLLAWSMPAAGRRPPLTPWLAGAVAALLLLSFGVGGALHERTLHERDAATREFALSEQIQEQAMEHTRTQLQRAGVDLGQQ